MSEHHIDFSADIKQNPTPLGALISQNYRNEALKKKKTIRRKKIALGLLSLILVGLTYFGFFFPTTREYLDNLIHRTPGSKQDFQSYISAKKATLSRTSKEAEWDGPSVFKTRAQNFNLFVGGGRLSGIVTAKQEPISQVELRLDGVIFYDDGAVKKTKIPVSDEQFFGDEDILHQGVRIVIKKSITDFTAMIRLEDSDDSSGTSKPISAIFEFTVVFPEHYDSYKKLSVLTKPIQNEAFDILFSKDLNIEFTTLDLQANGGVIDISTPITAERFSTYSLKTTRVAKVKNVPGQPIAVTANTVQEELKLNLVTSPVNKDETKLHSLFVGSRNGNVFLKIDPESKATAGTKYGAIDLNTNTGSGSISTNIKLADESQVLLIDSASIAGNIRTFISDNYSGAIGLESETQDVELYAKKDSKSTIEYEVKSSNKISATKSLPFVPEVGDGEISFTSKKGKVLVYFQ